MKTKVIFKLPKFHEKQLEIWESINNSTEKYHLAKCGRGFGKDILAQSFLLMSLLTGTNKTIYWISNLHAENKKTINLIMKKDPSGLIEVRNSFPLSLKFNSNRVEFYSFQNPESIRGKNFADLVIINEAPLMKDSDWQMVVNPILSFNNVKKVLILGTPNGENWFHSLWFSESDNIKKYSGTSYDNPYRNLEELEVARLSTPDVIFKQEYLAEFVSDNQSVYGDTSRLKFMDSLGEPSRENYGGLDIGQKNDYTVLKIINANYETIYFDRFKGLDWSSFLDRVAAPIEKYKAITLCDETGVGRMPVEELYKRLPNYIRANSQTNSKKVDMINTHLYLINTGIRKISKLEENLIKEMKAFRVKRGGLTSFYEAANGSHDDEVNADFLACWVAKSLIGVPSI
jgi:hypothetical protein